MLDVDCAKHGRSQSLSGDCIQCLEEAELDYITRIPKSICWGCGFCEDEPGEKVKCRHYGFPMRPIKKFCRYFEYVKDDFGEWY
jgi:hypothetical protein